MLVFNVDCGAVRQMVLLVVLDGGCGDGESGGGGGGNGNGGGIDGCGDGG